MSLYKKENMKSIKIEMEGVKNASKIRAITKDQGWDGWAMRVFTLGKDGYTPKHAHSWPHINYILSGDGTLFLDGKEQNVKAGDAAFVPGGEEHQFKNIGNEDFSFICIIPEE